MNRQAITEKVIIVIDDDTNEGDEEGRSDGRGNFPVVAPFERLDNTNYGEIKINSQTNVELVDGDFLRVVDIVRDTRTSETILRGWRFRRTREMNGLLERKSNEICWILEINEDDKREPNIQGMEAVPITHVCKRRLIRMTNRGFPELSWREDGLEKKEVIISDRVLVCRYKYVCTYADTNARNRNQWSEKALYRLRRFECDKLISVEDEALRSSWRGQTVKGGSWKTRSKIRIDLTIDDPSPDFSTSKGNRSKGGGGAGAKRSLDQAPWGQHHPSKRINAGWSPPNFNHHLLTQPSTQLLKSHDEVISSDESEPSYQPKQQRYTFGDCFCGAGGTSRGAIGAGLRISWGFDFSLPACQSFKQNFPAARVYNIWAHEFASLPDQDHKVDICHLSPPCQFFSDAHTVQGKDDEMNTATLFSVSQLLQKARPRIVTLEQTAGLVRRHSQFFNALVLMFTEQGFSIRWRLLQCADYGLPQNRLRLFMIAACPGESLPSFPPPTHSANPFETGLLPWTTINDAISHIPSNWPNHDVSTANPHYSPAQDGNQIARCMTTSGAGMIHPSGRRALTLREFAGLQGFPLEHMFSSVTVKKQIGNAVPPIVAKALLEEVKKALMKADGLLG